MSQPATRRSVVVALPRRRFLKTSVVIASSAPFGAILAAQQPDASRSSTDWPRYVVTREADELFFELIAYGYRESRFLSHRYLVPVPGFSARRLVFVFPPQHFAETAIASSTIPPVISDSQLRKITLLASNSSQIVVRPRGERRIRLSVEDLLDWHDADLVLPALEGPSAPPQYLLDVARDAQNPVTRIEMPWGIEMTPVMNTGEPYRTGNPLIPFWRHARLPRRRGEWVELWTTALVNPADRLQSFEVFSVRGFDVVGSSGSASKGDLRIQAADKPGTAFPEGITPLGNLERLDIGASLSRRFPYTGIPASTPIDTALIQYKGACVSVCYEGGRTVSVEQFRLSARGGWLQLDSKWTAAPGCSLTGWTHSASLGRDHRVEVVDAGFLYPFGTPCQLITLSERVFSKDERGHYVAFLIQQTFIEIPKINAVSTGHTESPFNTVRITTVRTPPLDPPPGGDPRTYRQYDFFLPTVNGQPFAFEHVGTDWAGDVHGSAMPMFFVNNRARSANGLIWEPGLPAATQKDALCSPTDPANPIFSIPKTGDGLRIVDKEWNAHPYRFAPYGNALIELSPVDKKGAASQRVEWVEWTRGRVVQPTPGSVAATPFIPRCRTFKFRPEGMGTFSGSPPAMLGTYRDTRFAAVPILDPEPTAPETIYNANLARAGGDATPYAYVLETRDLLSESSTPAPRSPDRIKQDIRSLYFGTSLVPNRIPVSLFESINNEIRFGVEKPSDGLGGLAVPDTHVSALTPRYGPVGDATFNERRWPGYATKKSRLEPIDRLDYAAYRRAYRSQQDTQPFDTGRSDAQLAHLRQQARALMGYAATPATFQPAIRLNSTSALDLGDLFGKDAQLLPGLSLADIFKDVVLAGSEGSGARPPEWKVKITGLATLLSFIGPRAGQIPVSELARYSETSGQSPETSTPIPFGIEATVDWVNKHFKDQALGPVKFLPSPGQTQFELHARAFVDLAATGLPADLKDFNLELGKPELSARAELTDFGVALFNAIQVSFAKVAFTLAPNGKKDFVTDIADVKLLDSLAFIKQLSDVLSSVNDEQGIKIDITPRRVQISQTLRFPPTEGEPLFIGPAQVMNLSFGWSVMIPLVGRDVLTVGFAVSSRENPLTIFVPPWYGGKAYFLMELTTRGVRLLEISMEYGALIPITWGIAKGEASLTAGIFYMVLRTQDSGTVTLRAFVKAAANLAVAGIIHFAGLIYVALTHETRGTVEVVKGEATVSVSVKIGFFRVSYSFTAEHQDKSGDSANAASLNVSASRDGSSASTVAVESSIPQTSTSTYLFAHMTRERQQAFERIVNGYQV